MKPVPALNRALAGGLAFCLALALSCQDRPEPTSPGDGSEPPGGGFGDFSLAIMCDGDVAQLQLTCITPQATRAGDGLDFLIVGGQGSFVFLEADPAGVSYDPVTQIFEADVTVQNLIGQALGTPDGATVTGVRVFFHSGPNVTSSTGGSVAVANPDGFGNFTGTNQPYFEYDQVLAASSPPPPTLGQRSQARTWQFDASPNITFSFTVFVQADVAYPDGWVDVTPSKITMDIGQTQTLSAVARDVLGREASERIVTWSSETPTIASVDPGTGEATALGLGATRICADSDGPEAQGCTRLEVVSQIFWDTIAGAISTSGEVDDYTFQGTAGMEVALFLRTLTGSLFDNLQAYLIVDEGTFDEDTLGSARSDGADTSLWGQGTGRLTLPRTTTYTVRVVGDFGDTGDYLIQVFLLDRSPEVTSPQVVFGDTIDVEAIEPPGDVDEYTFLGNVGEEVGATMQTLTGGLLNGLQLCVIKDAGVPGDESILGCVASDGDDTSLWGQSTERLTLPAATMYTIRVWAPDAQDDTDWGAYRYMALLVDRWPEVAPRDIVFEDTIDVESIGPPTDVDESVFTGSAGQEVAAYLQTLSGDFRNGLQLCVLADAGTLDELLLDCATSDGDDASMWAQSTERLTLPRTTTYTISVFAPGTQSDTDWGAYRYMAHLVDRAPEVAAPGVVFNDTVAVEAISPPGDVDEFTFPGAEGDEVVGFLQTLTGDFRNSLELCLVKDAGTQNSLQVGCTTSDGDDASLWGQSTGLLTLPATTTYTARVLAPTVQSDTDWGSFRYMILLVDRAPEDVGADFAINDTVAGEAIEPPGDIDEFTFQGEAGSSVRLFCQSFNGGFFERLEFHLLANAGTPSEQGLAECVSDGTDIDLEGQSTGVITFAETATYMVRVLGASDEQGQGLYRFHVRRQ